MATQQTITEPVGQTAELIGGNKDPEVILVKQLLNNVPLNVSQLG